MASRGRPKSSQELKLNSKNWKATVGAIENRNRPEALYVTFSTWVKPKLSVVKAQNTATSDPEDLVVSIMDDFIKELKVRTRSFKNFFDSNFFDVSSIIFDYNFEGIMAASPGKRQFIEMEINIDTVNDIDWDGNPTPSKGTGKMHNIPFEDFVKPMTSAINKILAMDIFNEKKATVSFAKTKGGK